MMKFSCRLCDYSSNRLGNVKRHETSKHTNDFKHTDDERSCPFCDRKFSTKYNCKRHVVMYCKEIEKSQSTNSTTQNVNLKTQNVNLRTQNVNISTQNVDTSSENDENDENEQHCTSTHAMYTCDGCQRTFSRRWNLSRHVLNCKGVTHPYQCHVCREIFSSAASKSRHLKTCKATTINRTPQTATPSTTQGTINIETQINNTTNQNANTINNNNITINVNLNNFGEETLDHITPDMLTRFAKEINNGLAKLIDTIHFHPDAPQNHNIRLENVKGQLVAVYQNNEWIIRDMNDAVTNMITNGCRLLTNHYYSSEDLQKEDNEQHYGIIQKRLSSIGCKDRTSYFPTRRLVIASLHNHRSKQSDTKQLSM